VRKRGKKGKGLPKERVKEVKEKGNTRRGKNVGSKHQGGTNTARKKTQETEEHVEPTPMKGARSLRVGAVTPKIKRNSRRISLRHGRGPMFLGRAKKSGKGN